MPVTTLTNLFSINKKLPGIHPGSLQAELKGRYLAAEIIWMWYTSLPSAALRPVA